MNHAQLNDKLSQLTPAQREALLRQVQQQKPKKPTLGIKPSPASVYPLTQSQKRMWILAQLNPEACHIGATLSVKGDFNSHFFTKALQAVLDNQPCLRLYFKQQNDQLVQAIQPSITLPLATFFKQYKNTEQLITDFIDQPFDLFEGPLWRVGLIETAPNCHTMVFVIHHIISDSWSTHLLLKEIAQTYNQLLKGTEVFPQKPRCHFGDYAIWLNEKDHKASLQKDTSFWIEQLKSISPIALPRLTNAPVTDTQGGHHKWVLPSSLVEKLEQLCKQYEVSLFHALMAAFQIFLYRLCQQDDFAIGTPVAGRTHPDTFNMPGLFINTLAFPNAAKDSLSFTQLLQKIKLFTLNAQQHQHLPFESLVEKLALEDNSVSPVFQAFFSFQSDNGLDQLQFNKAIVQAQEATTATAKFDLSLITSRYFDEIHCLFEYKASLFEPETLAQFQLSFDHLLTQLCQQPDRHIAEHSLVNTEQANALMKPIQDSSKPIDVLQLLNQQYQQSPQKMAIVVGETAYSYQQVHQRANQLAHYLHEKGVKPQQKVGIQVQNGYHLVTAILAIIKTNAVYTPIDHGAPIERRNYIINDANLALLLVDSNSSSSVLTTNINSLCLDKYPIEPPNTQPNPEDLLYLLYTSGSTGNPKGALVKHDNAARLIEWYGGRYKLGENDRVLVSSSFAFDLTQKNLLSPLCFGATLHFLETGIFEPVKIIECIETHKITWFNTAPSAFYPVIAHCNDFSKLNSLRNLFLGGESIDIARLSPWLESTAFSTQLINMYGPTECTDITTTYQYQGGESVLPIGKAIDHVQLYIVDQQLRLLPKGAIGELCIAGSSVGAGYLHTNQSNNAFVLNPYQNTENNNLLYRTGDWVRYNQQDDLIYIGRKDDQIKIHGHRIDFNEIEQAIKEVIDSKEVIVTTQACQDQSQLVAFLKTDQPLQSTHTYRSALQQKLSPYMIPVAFNVIDEIPLSQNGKRDRKKLPKVSISLASETPFIAPTNPIEAELSCIFSSLLKNDKISIIDNFFEIGGHSLLATELLLHIKSTFNIDLPMRTLFEVTTIKGLSEVIYALQADETSDDEDFEEGVL